MGLHPFTTYVLRKYYQATGWNEDNFYSNLTRSSDALLDFRVPSGLQFSISKAPNSLFRTTYCMNALPSLNASFGYIFSTCPLDLKSSGTVQFKDVVERFKVYDVPRRPEGKPEEWLAGRRVDTRDFLLSGLMYIPSSRLDAFYSRRLSASLQASVASITEQQPTSSQTGDITESSSGSVLLSVQQDTGRWGTEYTWNSDGGILGVSVMRNFGRVERADGIDEFERNAAPHASSSPKRVDEEELMEGGLKGRVSAGAEFYVSPEKSAGISTGIRFTTLPDIPPAPEGSAHLSAARPSVSQPPTTISAVFNPITGHILAAYAAGVSPDLAVCSRFSFNIHSYESEWMVGTEWWMRRRPPTQDEPSEEPLFGSIQPSDEVRGVLKARVSTSADIALMWEGRIHNALVSLGVKSNLSDRTKPISAIGLELAYFSSE